jgi:hypothetical protein
VRVGEDVICQHLISIGTINLQAFGCKTGEGGDSSSEEH